MSSMVSTSQTALATAASSTDIRIKIIIETADTPSQFTSISYANASMLQLLLASSQLLASPPLELLQAHFHTASLVLVRTAKL